MITFEEIKKANESIATTDVKGKEYAEVNQRVKAFRIVYPTGFILPSAVIDENGACTYVCEVGYYTEGGGRVLLARGSAKEEKNASYINKTSYIENCETSAVGRALGFAGFGIDTSICSADELKNALDSQEQTEKNENQSKKEPTKADPPKAEPPKQEQPKAEASKAEQPKKKTEQDDEIKALRAELNKKAKEIMSVTGFDATKVNEILCDKCSINQPIIKEDYQQLLLAANVMLGELYDRKD